MYAKYTAMTVVNKNSEAREYRGQGWRDMRTSYRLGKFRRNPQFVHRGNQAADIVADEFRQHFVFHGGIGLRGNRCDCVSFAGVLDASRSGQTRTSRTQPR